MNNYVIDLLRYFSIVDIVEKNPHAECQKLAAQTLMILQNIVQKVSEN